MAEPRIDPAPLDVDAVPVVAVGTALWAVALGLCLVFRERLANDGRSWWWAACAWGVALGLIGLRHVRRRRAAIVRAESAVTDDGVAQAP